MRIDGAEVHWICFLPLFLPVNVLLGRVWEGFLSFLEEIVFIIASVSWSDLMFPTPAECNLDKRELQLLRNPWKPWNGDSPKYTHAHITQFLEMSIFKRHELGFSKYNFHLVTRELDSYRSHLLHQDNRERRRPKEMF